MTTPRAFEVSKDGDPSGFLGEGRGPFVFATASSLPFPWMPHARFTCLNALHEWDIAEILERGDGFDETVRALESAGFVLSPVAYDAVFQPLRDVPKNGRGSGDGPSIGEPDRGDGP